VLVATLVALLLAGADAGAESAPDAGGASAGSARTDAVPEELKVAVRDYVADPMENAARLVALVRRSSDIDLPPEVEIVTADAYLRLGNRRGAERLFQQALESDPGYPWQDFGNVGMGTVRLMSGDADGAEQYFGRLGDAGERSSRVLGDLGTGAALATSGRYDEARAAFDAAAATENVDPHFRQAGQFGSASARYAAGDYEGAARAFEELAATDPDGPMGRDARFAAARARLALGQFDEGTDALRKMQAKCGDERKGRRPSRALRNLDQRAINRIWLRNYRSSSWKTLFERDNSVYSIDGCALARATLPAAERSDPRLLGGAVQRVSVGSAEPAPRQEPTDARAPRGEPVTPVVTSTTGWLPFAIAVVAAAALALLWFRRSSGSRA
jgi:tetratricopeptide (TPR) repeat protein